MYPLEEEKELERFHTDEEAEQDDQEEDMKEYQNKLNEKIDVLVEALRQVHDIVTSEDPTEQKKNVTKHFDDFINERQMPQEDDGEGEDQANKWD